MAGASLVKLLLIGDLGVGKTALMNRFEHNYFNPNYQLILGLSFVCSF